MEKESVTQQTDNNSSKKNPISKIKMGKTKELIKRLPEKKAHFEFISAVLTIPVLITVLLLNLNNLLPKNTKPTLSPTPSVVVTLSETPVDSQRITSSYSQSFISPQVTSVLITSTPEPTTNQNQCTPGIGSIDIGYPTEGQIISNNPVCIGIDYNAGNYCSVVWAYSINGSPLSDYSNNSVCLYNLPSGNNSFTLQVKSLVSNDTNSITRHFNYNPPVQPTVTLTPTASASSSASTH